MRPVKHDILDKVAQRRGDLGVDAKLAGIHDAHRQALTDGVVQEHRVNGLAHRLIAAKRKADVRNAARNARVRERLPDPASGLDEIDRVMIVLVDPGRDGKHVRIKDDVFGREADHVDQEPVSALADQLAPLEAIGLALLVKRHHHRSGAVAAAQPRMAKEGLFAFLEGYRVDDRLALHALQTGLDHIPLGTVDHHGHTGDVGLGCDEVEEPVHARGRVQHGLVHVDIDDLRTALDLLARHRKRLVVLFLANQAGEHLAARHVGTLADVHEQRFAVNIQGLEPRKTGLDGDVWHRARRKRCDTLRDRLNVIGGRAAASTGHVDQAGARELLEQAGSVGRQFVETGVAHRIGQAGVRIDTHIGFADLGQLCDVRAHQGGAQRAVQTDRDRSCVTHGIPEGLDGLPGKDSARGVGDGSRNHDRQALAAGVEYLFAGENGSLRVQRIENRLDQDEIDTAVE